MISPVPAPCCTAHPASGNISTAVPSPSPFKRYRSKRGVRSPSSSLTRLELTIPTSASCGWVQELGQPESAQVRDRADRSHGVDDRAGHVACRRQTHPAVVTAGTDAEGDLLKFEIRSLTGCLRLSSPDRSLGIDMEGDVLVGGCHQDAVGPFDRQNRPDLPDLSGGHLTGEETHLATDDCCRRSVIRSSGNPGYLRKFFLHAMVPAHTRRGTPVRRSPESDV